MTHIKQILLRLRTSTPLHTFIFLPLLVVACELFLRGGELALDLWGVPLIVLGYAQYRLVGNFRTAHGGGGPGIGNPPTFTFTLGHFASAFMFSRQMAKRSSRLFL